MWVANEAICMFLVEVPELPQDWEGERNTIYGILPFSFPLCMYCAPFRMWIRNESHLLWMLVTPLRVRAWVFREWG